VLAMDDRRDEVKRASEQEETTYLQKHDVYPAAEHGARLLGAHRR
jgi:hypothetical protein